MTVDEVPTRSDEEKVPAQERFEALLSELSASFINLPSAKVDQEIEAWLERLARFLGVERCSVGQPSSDRKLVLTHTYCAPGVPPPPQTIEGLTWYTGKVGRGEIVALNDLPDSLPEEAVAEREHVLREGMKGHVGIPLMVGGSLIGLLGMAWFRPVPRMPPEIVSRLRLIGEVFGNALARKRSDELLRRSEERFRMLVETAPDAMVLIAPDGRILLVNRQAELLFGYAREELLGQPVELLVPEALREKHIEHRRRYGSDPRPRAMGGGLLLHGRRKDGSEVPIEVSLSPLETEEGWVVTSLIRDITRRKRTEQALRELSGRLISAQEEERTRVARELHDDVSQRLALLSVELEQLAQRPAATAVALGRRVDEMLDKLKGLSSDVHRLSHRLHPSKLDHLGLVAAVKAFCQEYIGRRGIRVQFHHEDIPGTLPQDVALCLYRIVQEALANVAKHSGADEVDVELTGTGDSIRLRISDSGVGFDSASPEAFRGLGLISMRERLRLVGGTMGIDSAPSRGTRVQVTIPLPPSPHQETPSLPPAQAAE